MKDGTRVERRPGEATGVGTKCCQAQTSSFSNPQEGRLKGSPILEATFLIINNKKQTLSFKTLHGFCWRCTLSPHDYPQLVVTVFCSPSWTKANQLFVCPFLQWKPPTSHVGSTQGPRSEGEKESHAAFLILMPCAFVDAQGDWKWYFSHFHKTWALVLWILRWSRIMPEGYGLSKTKPYDVFLLI